MSNQALHVAVGVIRDANGNVLITRRPKHVHQGGLWEFPGGKVEAGETVSQALRRELHEELGLEIEASTPLIQIDHEYPERRVLLDVWEIDRFSGTPHGREGQAMQWVASQQLKSYDFPAANRPIINATLLPRRYAILEGRSHADIIAQCEHILARGIELVQLRAKGVPRIEIDRVHRDVKTRCRECSVTLLMNSDLGLSLTADEGLHLSSRALLALGERPAGPSWIGASCHTPAEITQAQRLGLDFIVIAPVLPTPTHPEATPLGWQGLQALIAHSNLPVFALGGLREEDLDRAIDAGAQGIAGISAFSG